jgi:ABC-type polysaccharide/polyol phosphate transport system ATPase subunit
LLLDSDPQLAPSGTPAPTAAGVPPFDGRAVVVEDLSVHFRTTSESVLGRLNTFRRGHRFKARRRIDALSEVSFGVPRGSVFGVIGRNGAGKSTLFRAIAGILAPDEGRVITYGHVTPLLSLGIGFNRELTGRENTLLGGLAAGLELDEIKEHYEEIVEFADLGEAIDSPMRTYSSGMFGRLGFAISTHLRPDILLIDEALSAGDARFKKKCMKKIVELCERDATVMIVTHGVAMVRRFADECLWLEGGRVRMIGPAKEVVAAYTEHEDEGDADDAASEAVDEDI